MSTGEYLTSGDKSLIFQGYGTPISAGTDSFILTMGINSCLFSINVTNPTVPTVITATVTNTTETTATTGGTVTSDGGVAVTARGVCWSISSNPTIAGSHTTDGSGTGAFVSNLTGLLANTLYYVRAYATNSVGTSYGNQVSFTTLSFSIGLSYGGGIIFYIDGTGQHGLISATSDQSTGAEWGCYGTAISGADGTAIGTGNQNTIDIMAGCSTAGIAARLCGDLVLGGYSDWYLPSKDELDKLFLNRSQVGGFSYIMYWNSSEYDINTAWFQSFTTGSTGHFDKSITTGVRAIRAF
jgi:hypothetical protein